jgi:hypothetical protein
VVLVHVWNTGNLRALDATTGTDKWQFSTCVDASVYAVAGLLCLCCWACVGSRAPSFPRDVPMPDVRCPPPPRASSYPAASRDDALPTTAPHAPPCLFPSAPCAARAPWG